MSEPVLVRRVKVEVTVTREIIVVLPMDCTAKEARALIKEYDLNEITDGQDVDFWVGEVTAASVNPESADLYVISEDGLGPAKGCDWTKPENIGKYLVKS